MKKVDRARYGVLALLAPLLFALISFVAVASTHPKDEVQGTISHYIEAWKDYYPSQAFAYGDVESAAAFEDFSEARVQGWLTYNTFVADNARSLLASPGIQAATKTDLQVLRAQAENELASWDEDAPLSDQPQWYAEQVSQALTYLLVRDQLSELARSDAAVARVRGVAQLCRLGVASLTGGNALRTDTALRILAGAREFYSGNLRELVADWPKSSGGSSVDDAVAAAIPAIGALENHLRENILPGASTSASIGEMSYAAKLSRRTWGLYTPDRLLAASGEEMQGVRALMRDEAVRWRDTLPMGSILPRADVDVLDEALAAMESDRQDNSADFLKSFSDLTFAAERFVEENVIATVPKPTTLIVALSPSHFSGAAVGGVYPSGPFAPQADTLFYVPSIADTASARAKTGFYRSFNTHFNTMIMSHEMFPGHYLQYKVAVAQASAVRSLFANGSYIEGWGSFSEELMLDAGWADNAPLTRLAHLRKRLENASRAYVSVMVNTQDWGEDEVLVFARDKGLLAPQFAQNLWQRVVNSPLQITDYFTGYTEFKRLYVDYQVNTEQTATRAWVDAVLRAGPVPMALLESELQNKNIEGKQ